MKGAYLKVTKMEATAVKKFSNVAQCPVRNVLDRIGDKWSVLVLLILGDKTMRFNELQREIGEISQKMLVTTLKHLEADGLVLRQLFAEVPLRVEYSLTPLGESLLPSIHQLTNWSVVHMEAILKSREAYQQINRDN